MHDLRVSCGAPGAAHPELRIEDDARRSVEHGLRFFRQQRVAIEVFPVGVCEGLHIPAGVGTRLVRST